MQSRASRRLADRKSWKRGHEAGEADAVSHRSSGLEKWFAPRDATWEQALFPFGKSIVSCSGWCSLLAVQVSRRFYLPSMRLVRQLTCQRLTVEFLRPESVLPRPARLNLRFVAQIKALYLSISSQSCPPAPTENVHLVAIHGFRENGNPGNSPSGVASGVCR